jgi:HAD superfamily hydrolase (TIGR01509 family)
VIKHILFDNDGTLVDSEIIAIRALLDLLKPYGIHLQEKTFGQRFTGLQTEHILEMLQAEHDFVLGEDFRERLHATCIEGFDQSLSAISGMPELVRRLKTPKSMVSNASLGHVERCLVKIGLRSAIDGRIFSAEQVERPKPHPDVYHFALETLELRETEAIVVEDSITGVIAAHAAGLRVVGFLGAAHIHDGHREKLVEAGAHHIAKDARALGRVFESLNLL